MKRDIYNEITQKIIKQLENVDPNDWNKPWFNLGIIPYNAISKKQYNGINHIMLSYNDYSSNVYATFKQWKDKDCKVKKGEKGHLIVFWKLSQYEDKDTGKIETVPFLKHSTVFNSEQVNGNYARKIESEKLNSLKEHNPIDSAEKLVRNYIANERIKEKHSDKAYYSSSDDLLAMPLLGQFHNKEDYYSTYLHEMTHSTGNKKRLKRELGNGFGSVKYAKEELIAELGSAMLCASIGLDKKPIADHAKYIASWLQVLKNDKKFIISAASKAQKACDFIHESAENYQAFLNKQSAMAAE